MQDFEAAKMFIDQLEMLEAKTKGNLTPEEEKRAEGKSHAFADDIRAGH